MKPTRITQEEIDLLIAFENLIQQRMQIYQRLYTGALDRLRAGIPVERGEHTLRLGEGGWYLIIDGQPHTEFISLRPGRPQ